MFWTNQKGPLAVTLLHVEASRLHCAITSVGTALNETFEDLVSEDPTVWVYEDELKSGWSGRMQDI